jgi:hypothetical protein
MPAKSKAVIELETLTEEQKSYISKIQGENEKMKGFLQGLLEDYKAQSKDTSNNGDLPSLCQLVRLPASLSAEDYFDTKNGKAINAKCYFISEVGQELQGRSYFEIAFFGVNVDFVEKAIMENKRDVMVEANHRQNSWTSGDGTIVVFDKWSAFRVRHPETVKADAEKAEAQTEVLEELATA